MTALTPVSDELAIGKRAGGGSRLRFVKHLS